MQFTKQDWRNRNYLKGNDGRVPMIVPVARAGGMKRRLRDAVVADNRFGRKHLRTLTQYYGKTPFFEEVYSAVAPVLTADRATLLSDLNIQLINEMCKLAGIGTRLIRDDEIGDFADVDRMDRLLRICSELGATTYVSGPAAEVYIDDRALSEMGIELEYFEYPSVAYEQVNAPFDENVSALDLLCCAGGANYLSVRIS